jgi:hypothetical protein
MTTLTDTEELILLKNLGDAALKKEQAEANLMNAFNELITGGIHPLEFEFAHAEDKFDEAVFELKKFRESRNYVSNQ